MIENLLYGNKDLSNKIYGNNEKNLKLKNIISS